MSNYVDMMVFLLVLLLYFLEIVEFYEGVIFKLIVFVIDEFDLFVIYVR